MHRVARRRPTLVGFAVALALVLGLAAAPAPAASGGAARTSPAAARATERTVAGIPILPVSELRRGMVGHGLTVISGTEVRSFGVRILGVQPDGIAPGIDFILVELFGDLIDRTGGVVAGMSGSPVYVNGRLVGAVAYGFYGGEFRVAGLTPAEPMLEILEYPSTLPARPEVRWPERVALAPALREAAVAAAGGEGEMRQLLIPLAVSGLNDRGLRLLREGIRDAGLPFVVTTGARAAAPRRPERTAPLPPGSVYSAVLSYGDLTVAGIGTTTARAGRRSVAFGHPFFFTGPARMGLNGGSVVGVVRNILSPFKVANVGLPHGLLTQDRLAGVGGVAGRFPDLTPVRARLRNADLGVTRGGATRIVRDFEFLDSLAFSALLAEFDRAFDRIGSGTSRLSWTITGTRRGGEGFRFHRENMFRSDFDIAIDALIEPAFLNLSAILHNPFEPVRITSMRLEGDVSQRDRTLEIARVRVASSSHPEPVEFGVQARPGDVLMVTVTLRPPRGDAVEKTLRLQVPGFATRGTTLQLVVRGGRSAGFDFFFFEEPEAAPEAGSLDDLLAQLEAAERNNDLIVELQEPFVFEGEGEAVVADGIPPEGGFALAQTVRTLRQIVEGEFFVDLTVT